MLEMVGRKNFYGWRPNFGQLCPVKLKLGIALCATITFTLSSLKHFIVFYYFCYFHTGNVDIFNLNLSIYCRKNSGFLCLFDVFLLTATIRPTFAFSAKSFFDGQGF